MSRCVKPAKAFPPGVGSSARFMPAERLFERCPQPIWTLWVGQVRLGFPRCHARVRRGAHRTRQIHLQAWPPLVLAITDGLGCEFRQLLPTPRRNPCSICSVHPKDTSAAWFTRARHSENGVDQRRPELARSIFGPLPLGQTTLKNSPEMTEAFE